MHWILASPFVPSSGRVHLQSAWIGKSFPKWCFVSLWICFWFCLLTASAVLIQLRGWKQPCCFWSFTLFLIPSPWLALGLGSCWELDVCRDGLWFICGASLPFVLQDRGVTAALFIQSFSCPSLCRKPRDNGEGLICSFLWIASLEQQ